MGFRIERAGGLAAALLAACSANPVYQGPQTDRTALLNVRADGIYAHPSYPDDVVWARLYRRGSSNMLGTKKLTVEVPIARFALDADTAYVVEFVSIEAQFGGYTNCIARMELAPLEGERYAVTYRTAKSSCRVEGSLLDAQTGRYTMVTSQVGVAGPAQSKAR